MLVADARRAADLLGPLLHNRIGEALAVAHLDQQGRVLGVIGRGGVAAAVELPLRDIMAEGVRTGASAMVVAHNHPSGDCAPSDADIAATRRLAELGEALGIHLHDHLIFGRTGCSSMRALGLL